MGVGVILFVLGFLGEKSHLYMTPHNEESLNILHKHEAKGYKMLTQSEQKYFTQNKGGAPLSEAESILIEYYHELPYTVDELKSKIASVQIAEIMTNLEKISNMNTLHVKHGINTDKLLLVNNLGQNLTLLPPISNSSFSFVLPIFFNFHFRTFYFVLFHFGLHLVFFLF